MKEPLIAAVLVLSFFLIGCPFNPEKAEDAIAVASGLIEQAQDDYEVECTMDPTLSHCQTINKGIHGLQLTIIALDNYCNGPQWKEEDGECDPPKDETIRKQLEQRFKDALNDLNPILEAVKGLSQ